MDRYIRRACARLIAVVAISFVANFAVPLTFPNASEVLAQTKTCGPPSAPTCPAALPEQEPMRYSSVNAQPYGPFPDLKSIWKWNREVYEPVVNNRCTPSLSGVVQPAPYYAGTTPAYKWPPDHLLVKDSWAINYIIASPRTGLNPCSITGPSTDAVLGQAEWYCPQGTSLFYTAGPPQLGPYCATTYLLTPDLPPPPKAAGCGPCNNAGGGTNSGGAGPASGATIRGNPVDVSNGNKFEIETDYSGTAGLRFTRSYSSLNAYYLTASNYVQARKTVGPAWTATYFQYIFKTDGTDSTGTRSTIYARRPDGHLVTFVKYLGVYVPSADIADQVVFTGSGFTYRTASDEVEIYDLQGRLLSITPRGGPTVTVSYADPDDLYPSTVTNAFGQTLTFHYDLEPVGHTYRLLSIDTPASGTISYDYDSAGRLVKVTYPDATTRKYGYGASGNSYSLTELKDETDTAFATWSYSPSTGLRVLSSQHAGGVESYSFSYPAFTFQRTVTDPLGTVRIYGVQTVQGVSRTTTASSTCPGCGDDASRVYDPNGNISSRTDFNGNVTNYIYDQDRNLETSRTEAYGTARARTITTAWHSTFRLPTSITEANRTTSFTHDANGNVLTRTVTDTSVIPNVARTWTYTYNAFGKVLTEDGPRTDVTDVTTYTYYTCTTGFQCGQLNTITNAAGHVTTYNSYNAHGKPTQITDPNGLVTSLAYDARQRMTDRCVGSTLPACTGGELTHLDYWPTGLLKKVTNPDASYIQYTYDAAHRLTQINDGASNKIVYTLDNMGNRTAENSYDPSLALKRTHSRVFNTLNQLWKDVNAAGTANVTTVFGYDNNGNQNSVAAPLSRNSSNLYDELNRLKQITDPNSGITLFGYDANDNLTSVTDPRTLATTYTYTGFGDLKTQTSPDTGLTTNTYDSGGNLKTSTDARSAISTYTYDTMNRVSTVAYKIGATTDQTYTYTYDGGVNQKGRLTGATDGSNPLAWTYDAQGRVVGKAQTFAITSGTSSLAIGYGYNALGQLFHVVLPSGKAITYGYNSNGQVSSVTLDGSPSTTILNNVTYDPFGPITGWTWGNGTASATRTFDTDGKLTALSNTPSTTGNRTFGYDDAFRITSTTDSAIGGPVVDAWLRHSRSPEFGDEDRVPRSAIPTMPTATGFRRLGPARARTR